MDDDSMGRAVVPLSARLWSDSAGVADDVLAHPFVRGIGDGTLPRELFAGYLAQDAFFLESFARAYALALARSADTATLLTLADLLGGVRQELGLHASYAAEWGIEMAGVQPWPATLAYTEFLLATACTREPGVIYAAMSPCMRLYAWLGASLDAQTAGPYAQWVQTYADPAFDEIAGLLERLLDGQTGDTAPVRTAYARAMRLELGFFEAAFRAGH